MSAGDTIGYLIFGNPISQSIINIASNIAKNAGITPKKLPPPVVAPVVTVAKVTLHELIGGNYNFVRLAGISGGIAVIMSAYGKQIFDNIEDPLDQKEAKIIFKSANQYHYIHTLALLAMPLAHKPYLTGTLMTVGTILFTGPMYYRAITGDKSYVTVATFGGFCLIAAWFSLIF